MRAALAVCLVAALPAAARAAPWHAEADLGGSVIKLDLDASGALTIATATGTATVQIARSVSRAVMSAARVQGVPTVVVDATTSAGDEGIVLQQAGAAWTELLRTPLGAVDPDGDATYGLAATPIGVIRYQSRAGYHRCDGKPALLFAEGYDGHRFRRLSRIPTLVADGAPVIAAHPDASAAVRPQLYQARVASTEAGVAGQDVRALAIPTELDDGSPATAWHEDFVASDGSGQFFTYEPRVEQARATELRIMPEGQAPGRRAANRPHRLAVVWAAGAVHVDLPDAANDPPGTAYVAKLPSPVIGCVSVVIESTYGPSNGETSIAELEVFAQGEREGGGDGLLASAVAEGEDTQSAGQELARRGAAGVAAIEAELAKSANPDARGRLVRALLAIRDPAAGPVLAHAITEGWVEGGDLVDAVAALGPLGEWATLVQLAGKDELALPARVAAVRALAGKPEAALDLAGRGPRELRRAVIEVATAVPTDALARAARAETRPAGSGDLWRALTRRAHASPAERPAALAAMVAALPAATDYERRYRLVDGIAAIGDTAALTALDALLRGLPRGAERAAFGEVAANAIAVNPRPEALALIVALARDPDPGVRIAALDALAGADTGPAGPWHAPDGPDGIDRVIGTLLETDTWPEVRRRAAQALGGRCTRPGPERVLADAVVRDPEVTVRGDALAALVECKASGTAALLARVWDDRKAPLELRRRAIDLSVELGDRALALRLVARLAAWRDAALDDSDALALAQNAAYAVGRLAPPGAAEALTAGLDDAGFPEIIASSATGLGLLGPACPAAARARLRVLAGSDEQQVATAAAHAAAVCGK